MKKLVCAALMLALVFSLAGCSLFSDPSVVAFDEVYTHHDPEGLEYDERTALKNDDFGETAVSGYNAMAWPDTMMYGEDGSISGMYDYDPEGGLAVGWMDLTTGVYTVYDEGEQVDLGKPDESMMVELSGTAALAAVVYGNEGEAVEADLYLFLSDASDSDTMTAVMAEYYMLDFAAESDTVLKCVQDADFIADQFAAMEEYGEVFDAKNAAAYADLLKLNYGLKAYGAVNPYKPYEGAEDPEDIAFDEKIVLTGAGSYSLYDQSMEKDLQCRTDVIYGYEGTTVAAYTYYEFGSADTVDKILDAGMDFFNPIRVSDTVVLDALSGSTLDEILAAYEGYGMIGDRSAESYAEYMEGCYFSMRCE